MKTGFYQYAERNGNRNFVYYFYFQERVISCIIEKDLPREMAPVIYIWSATLTNFEYRDAWDVSDSYCPINFKNATPIDQSVFYEAVKRCEKFNAPKEAVKTCQRTIPLPFPKPNT